MGCERGQGNTESSEFITCLKPSCKPQGQSCEKSGDCCDDNVCKSLLGGRGKVCIAPPPPPSLTSSKICMVLVFHQVAIYDSCLEAGHKITTSVYSNLVLTMCRFSVP